MTGEGASATLHDVREKFPSLFELMKRVSGCGNPYWTPRVCQLLKPYGIPDSSAGLSGDGRPSQCQVREALTKAVVVPIGIDPCTKYGGAFGFEAQSVQTAAHSAEASIRVVKYATGLPEHEVEALLKAWARNALDVLRSKTSARPPLGQLRSEATEMVKELIQRVEREEDKTVVALLYGWVPELLLQWHFNTAKITYTAKVKVDGSNTLADNGVLHSEPDEYSNVYSRMMPASCAHPRLKQLGLGHGPRPTHEPLSQRGVCAARLPDTGAAVVHVRLLKAGQVVRTFTACSLGHGGGSGAGQHAASVERDALGFARAVVGQTTMPTIDVNIEAFGFI